MPFFAWLIAGYHIFSFHHHCRRRHGRHLFCQSHFRHSFLCMPEHFSPTTTSIWALDGLVFRSNDSKVSHGSWGGRMAMFVGNEGTEESAAAAVVVDPNVCAADAKPTLETDLMDFFMGILYTPHALPACHFQTPFHTNCRRRRRLQTLLLFITIIYSAEPGENRRTFLLSENWAGLSANAELNGQVSSSVHIFVLYVSNDFPLFFTTKLTR